MDGERTLSDPSLADTWDDGRDRVSQQAKTDGKVAKAKVSCCYIVMFKHMFFTEKNECSRIEIVHLKLAHMQKDNTEVKERKVKYEIEKFS